jgi:hypothetical protein
LEEIVKQEIWPKMIWNSKGEQKVSEVYLSHKVGDLVPVRMGAPGYGYVTYKVTSKDDEKIIAIPVEDRGEMHTRRNIG